VIPSILVVVNEHGGGIPILTPPREVDKPGSPPLNFTRKCMRSTPHIGKAEGRLDPNVDVQPLATRSLGKPNSPKLGKNLLHHEGDLPNGVKGGPRHGIEIDPPLIRLLSVNTPRVPGMKLNTGHLNGPDHRSQFCNTKFISMPPIPRKVHPNSLNPRRRPTRQPLLMHLLPINPIGKPMHHARPLPQSIDDPRTNRQVVKRKVKLGLPPSREVNPLRVAKTNRPIPNLKLLKGSTLTSHKEKVLRNRETHPGRVAQRHHNTNCVSSE
jgi:hypothetical protein